MWDFQKFNIMKIDIKTILLLLIIAILATFFTLRNNYMLRIEELNSKLDSIQKENDSLYSKLDVIKSKFDEIRPSKTNRYKKDSQSKVVVIEKATENSQTGMEKFELIMDSIQSTLPNRTGQDLINSLKIKTEI